MVLHDEQGDRIHAIIKRPQVEVYKTMIKEHKICALRTFLVLDNYQTVKTRDHPYLIQFISKTQFIEDTRTVLPMMVYDFQPFDMLQAQRVINDKKLIDVIGKVICKSGVQNHIISGRTERMMELTLGDPEGNRLGCVLWNKYIDQYMEFVTENVGVPVYVIFQLCRPKRYQGTLSVSSSFDVSKLIINGRSSEFTEFQSEFPSDGDDSVTAITITLSSNGDGSREDVLAGQAVITTIQDLVKATEDGVYWIIGDIVSLENYREWCYLGCPTCHKKLKPEDDRFMCTNCHVTMADGVYRYKVSICIMDQTGHSTFILWDRECIEVFGKTSAFLMAEMEKKTEDQTRFPEDIESLVDQKGLFKIQLKTKSEENTYKKTKSFTVVTMIRDPKVLALYETDKEQISVHDTPTAKIGSSLNDGEGSTARKKMKDVQTQEVVEAIDLPDSPPLGTQKEVEVEMDGQLKRNLIDEFSTSGAGKKLKIKVKEEPL
ncbi:unnamed protein product [Cuscuta epithymum]|uniref:Replication factor A C-terminal domain-containing protein n=1 Tax=Cuscuta epithymum TaxID=186058 RepID=A0AAV0FT41_9ASTE|nr:unnamed protein product [Cuscuta epithymum]